MAITLAGLGNRFRPLHSILAEKDQGFSATLDRMVRRPVLACLLAIAPWCAAAQDSLPPGILLLSRIKRHVREEMGRLPDYPCLETSQRYRSGAAGRGGLKPYDTMRVEVLYSGDKELYAAPGAHDFRSDGPDAFAAGGLLGPALFDLRLRTI